MRMQGDGEFRGHKMTQVEPTLFPDNNAAFFCTAIKRLKRFGIFIFSKKRFIFPETTHECIKNSTSQLRHCCA